MYVITWLIVGLFAGMLAVGLAHRSDSNLFVDMAVAVVGAVLGGLLFEAVPIKAPLPAGPSAILAASCGAAMLLFLFVPGVGGGDWREQNAPSLVSNGDAMLVFKKLIDVLTLGSGRPLRRLVAYYVVLVVVLGVALYLYPGTNQLLIGGGAKAAPGVPQLLLDSANTSPVLTAAFGAGSLGGLAITASLILLGTVALMLPVTWVYMSARTAPGHNQAFVQTLLILPIVVAGIVLIVQNSLALAFSLAGVVAAVRFRTSLDDSRDIVFIFLAIGVGFAAGVQTLAVGAVFSVAFNFVVLLTWQYDFGRNVLQPTAASQWSDPLTNLAKNNGSNGNGTHGVPDRDLILALTPKKVDALAERFNRVRTILGEGKKKARYNAVLSVTSDKVGEAQVIVQKVLDRVAKRWVVDEVVTHSGKPSELYYLVRMGKSVTRDEVITAIRSRGDDTIGAVDLEVGDALAREKQDAKS